MALRTRISLAMAALLLAACGGGGGGGDTSNTLQLSGTAATGLAIAGKTVEAKCASGTGTATSGADGSYSVSVSGGTLPCVLRVTAADGTVLHAVAQGSGSSATVNITPLSELMLARLAGKKPADFFGAFEPAKITASAVTEAQAAVVSALQDIVDLSGINLLSDKLQAASGSSSGNAFDQKLDALKARLAAAQTTLDGLTQAMVDNSTASTSSSGAAVATLLRPSAQSCAALRSGKYRMVDAAEPEPAYQTAVVEFDATKLMWTVSGSSATATFTAVSGSPCEFIDSDGDKTYVAKSGIVVTNYVNDDGTRGIAFGFPEQQLSLADLAGTWNFVRFNRSGPSSPLAFGHGFGTIAANGSLTLTDCGIAATAAGCASASPWGRFAPATTGGGFSYHTNGVAQKMFAYRAPNGSMVMAMLFANNSGWVIGTKQTALSLPTVGTVTRYWDMSVSAGNVVSAVTASEATVASVDNASNSYTRKRLDGRVESRIINKPYSGLIHRPAGSSVLTNGLTVTFGEIFFLPLSDMGVTVYGTAVLDSTGFFGITLSRP